MDYAGWTPDFILFGTRGIIPVEVKPIEWSDDRGEMENFVLNDPDLMKVRLYAVANEETEILVLGAYPVECDGDFTSFCLGLFVEYRDNCLCLDPALLGAGYGVNKLDFFSGVHAYYYRIGGENDGGGHVTAPKKSDIRKHWGEASRLTQWKGK